MSQGDFWSRVKQQLKEAGTAAADFTEEQAMIGKLKFEILTISRKIERLQKDIGIRVTELSRLDPQPSPFLDAEVKGCLAQIKHEEGLIDAKKLEIERVANHFRNKAAARQREEAGHEHTENRHRTASQPEKQSPRSEDATPGRKRPDRAGTTPPPADYTIIPDPDDPDSSERG